jgi:hypothetical protein
MCDSVEKVNYELNKISDWMTVNKLSLNANKTKFISFHWHQNLAAVKFNPVLKNPGHVIEKVAHFIGITLDANLNWNQHVMELSNKLSRVNGVLSKLKNYIPSDILLTIYNTLFQSHLNYGVTCWGYNVQQPTDY